MKRQPAIPLISVANDFLRRWLVYPLILLGTALFYLQDLWRDLHLDILPAIIAFVSLVFVETIQRLEKIVLATQRDREFVSLGEAEGEMRRIVAKDRRITKVQVIAGPDRHILEATLPGLVSTSRARRIELDLQFVDEESPFITKAGLFPEWWADEIAQAVGQAKATFGDNERIKYRLSKYTYFPVLHGVLINERYLFLGFWGWGHGDGNVQLSGADRPQRLYVRHDPHTEHFFYLFEDWFENAPKKGLVREVSTWQGKNWHEKPVKRVAKRVAKLLTGEDEGTQDVKEHERQTSIDT